jgi:hypothetical protein
VNSADELSHIKALLLSSTVNASSHFYSSSRLGRSIAVLELQINNNFHVGYAYDVTTSDIRLYSNGSHEVMVNYRIKIPKLHQGIPCPSYW